MEGRMQSSHCTDRQIEAYRARRLGPEEILALQDHLAECPSCREKLAGAYSPAETGPAVEDHEVGEQELVDYAMGSLAGAHRSRIERHLATCAECRDVVAVLPAARRSASPARYWLAAAAVVVLLIPVAFWLMRRPAEPKLIASVADAGGRIELREGGDLAGPSALSAADRDLLRDVLRSGALPPGPAALAAEAPGVLRSTGGPSPAFQVLAPLDRRVLSDRPRFDWTAAAGARSYEVSVVTADLREVAQSEPLTVPGWRPMRPLPRGVPLQWQVVARVGGYRVVAPAPPLPPAAFEIVGGEAAQRIERALALQPPSRLLLAALYAREGLTAEARAELDRLAAANPADPLIDRFRRALAK
jgi:hypothetical protein